MKKVLTIAGSDCSGGAGIQADIKTITVHKMYAMSVITSLTAQNTTGVYGVADAEADFVARQLDCVFEDIYPDAVKIGMVSNEEIIKTIAKKLAEYKAKNIVADPVMVSTSGSRLISESAVRVLLEELLPLAAVITPNIPEGELLGEMKITNRRDMEAAAQRIAKKTGCAVLLKGGHSIEEASDVLYENGKVHWFLGERINNPNTHGTGCTLSSAIACNLAAEKTVAESVKSAKEYLTGAIRAGLDIGKGSGPLAHNYCI